MSATNETPVLLLTEDPMLEMAVRHLFASQLTEFALTCASNCETWRGGPESKQRGVILMEVSTTEQLERVATIRGLFPGVPLLCWCSPAIQGMTVNWRGMCDGVMSRLSSPAEVVETLVNAAGRPDSTDRAVQPDAIHIRLTYRESQLVTLLGRGYKNKDIAACLGITSGTVKIYLSTLFKKTGAKDRLELSLFGIKNSIFGSAEVSAPPPASVALRRVVSRPVITSMRLLQPVSQPIAQHTGAR